MAACNTKLAGKSHVLSYCANLNPRRRCRSLWFSVAAGSATDEVRQNIKIRLRLAGSDVTWHYVTDRDMSMNQKWIKKTADRQCQ
jgi:hypothetical protein